MNIAPSNASVENHDNRIKKLILNIELCYTPIVNNNIYELTIEWYAQ